MRKRIKMMAAAAMCACTLTIVGCGGGTTTNTNTNTETPAAEQQDPAEKFIGEWKLAYMESDGMTIAGDFSGLAALTDETAALNMTLKVNEDRTAAFAFGDESTDLTWSLDGENTMVMTETQAEEKAEGESAEEKAEEKSEPSTFLVTYEDDELRIDAKQLSDEEKTDAEGSSDAVTDTLENGTVVLTHDGTSDKATVVTLADAANITSKDQVVGTWNMVGMNMFGVYMYGDQVAANSMLGDDSATMVFNEDGTCTILGTEGTYTVGESGLSFSDSSGDSSDMPIKAVGDNLVLDMSEFMAAMMGSDDATLFMVYAK